VTLPAAWSVEEGAASFIVRDHDKHEDELGRRSSVSIAANVAKLPRLLRKP
jgi:hypothetical protein